MYVAQSDYPYNVLDSRQHMLYQRRQFKRQRYSYLLTWWLNFKFSNFRKVFDELL
jgi:hypothetical protein